MLRILYLKYIFKKLSFVTCIYFKCLLVILNNASCNFIHYKTFCCCQCPNQILSTIYNTGNNKLLFTMATSGLSVRYVGSYKCRFYIIIS